MAIPMSPLSGLRRFISLPTYSFKHYLLPVDGNSLKRFFADEGSKCQFPPSFDFTDWIVIRLFSLHRFYFSVGRFYLNVGTISVHVSLTCPFGNTALLLNKSFLLEWCCWHALHIVSGYDHGLTAIVVVQWYVPIITDMNCLFVLSMNIYDVIPGLFNLFQ